MKRLLLTVFMCALGIGSHAHAGIVVDDQLRLYGCGVTQGSQTLRSYDRIGYFQDTIFNTSSNNAGRSAVKLKHESLITNNAYKVSTQMSLDVGESTPRIDETGALSLVFVSLIIQEVTTLRINYDIEINQGLDSYAQFQLKNITDTRTEFLLNSTVSTQGYETLRLQPGEYRLDETTQLRGLQMGQGGSWYANSTFSISIIPSPGPLAMLFPMGLLAYRRHR